MVLNHDPSPRATVRAGLIRGLCGTEYAASKVAITSSQRSTDLLASAEINRGCATPVMSTVSQDTRAKGPDQIIVTALLPVFLSCAIHPICHRRNSQLP